MKNPKNTDMCYNLRLTGNLVADTYDYGYITPGQFAATAPSIEPDVIAGPDNKIVENNKAHCAFTGWLTIQDHTWCMGGEVNTGNLTVNGLTVYRTRGIAVASIARALHVTLGDMIIFDNARSLSMAAMPADIDAYTTSATLYNSCILGDYISTKMSDPCPVTCNSTDDDFFCQRSVGFLSAAFYDYDNMKAWPLPMTAYFILWYKAKTVQTREGTFFGGNVMFKNWNATNRCGKPAQLIISNRNLKSHVPTHVFEDAKFVNVDKNQLFYLVGWNASLLVPNSMCGGYMVCTGMLNALFKFQSRT